MTSATDHPCPGCDTPGVPNNQFACQPCWKRLPRSTRQHIIETRSLGIWSAVHRKVLKDATDELRARIPFMKSADGTWLNSKGEPIPADADA